MVVDVAPILSKLSELPATLLTLSLQVLLHSALLPMCCFLHMPPEQSLLKELLPTHITPVEANKHAVWRKQLANIKASYTLKHTLLTYALLKEQPHLNTSTTRLT